MQKERVTLSKCFTIKMSNGFIKTHTVLMGDVTTHKRDYETDIQ